MHPWRKSRDDFAVKQLLLSVNYAVYPKLIVSYVFLLQSILVVRYRNFCGTVKYTTVSRHEDRREESFAVAILFDISGYRFRVRLPGSLFDYQWQHTHTHNCFTTVWILSGTTRVSPYHKKHSPTHTHRGHQSSLSASSIYYHPWHPPYSIHVLYSLFSQSLSKFS